MRRVGFATAAGEAVEGFLLEPEGGGPAPAILYIHAHGGRYDIGAREVLDGREALAGPVGPALARAGFRVLALDMPCFGGRAGTQEGAAAKAAQWYGRSLAGQMLGELASALDWLAAESGDGSRRGSGSSGSPWARRSATGWGRWSRGSAAVAHLCCFADFAPLVASGAHDRHGHYLTVPGLLGVASNGEIAGLIAPRPQFVGLGEADALTPPDAVAPALAAAGGLCGGRGGGGAAGASGARGGAPGDAGDAAAVMAFLEQALG